MSSALLHPRRLAGILLIGALAGCSVTPEYKPPELKLPDSFREQAQSWAQAEPLDRVDRSNWWTAFKDPTLDHLIDEGVRGNFRVDAAVHRYEQAKAYLATANAALSPQVGLQAGSTDNRQSDNRPLRSDTQPSFYDDNFISAVATYEVDLWGKVRASIDAAQAQEQSSGFDLESLRLLIASDIASTYFLILGTDSQLDVIAKAIDSYERQAQIMSHRFQEGISAGADLYRAQSLVQTQRVLESGLKTRRAQLEHTLAILVGKSPTEFVLPTGDVYRLHVPGVPTGLPSQLLQRRPDIASAERRMASANSQIGVARSAFFPSLTLAATAGWENASTAPLINAPDLFWSIGPQMFVALFDGGRRDALVNYATQRELEEVANYRETVLGAIREVEDLMVDLRNREQIQGNIDDASRLIGKVYRVATSRYNEGIASYLEIVDAALQSTQIDLTRVDQRTRMLVGRATLVKALGGYWN